MTTEEHVEATIENLLREERTFPPQAPVKLYDAVIQEANGYLMGIGGVPPHHKRAIVSELMTAITLLDPDIDPNS